MLYDVLITRSLIMIGCFGRHEFHIGSVGVRHNEDRLEGWVVFATNRGGFEVHLKTFDNESDHDKARQLADRLNLFV
jgi:hypothetical protein